MEKLFDDWAHIKNSSEYKEASSNVARKHILRLRLRPATAQSRSETLRREVEISAERLGVAEHTFQEQTLSRYGNGVARSLERRDYHLNARGGEGSN